MRQDRTWSALQGSRRKGVECMEFGSAAWHANVWLSDQVASETGSGAGYDGVSQAIYLYLID